MVRNATEEMSQMTRAAEAWQDDSPGQVTRDAPIFSGDHASLPAGNAIVSSAELDDPARDIEDRRTD
jgi:hypothetical protein